MAISLQQVKAVRAVGLAGEEIARALTDKPVAGVDLEHAHAFATFLEKIGRATLELIDEVAELKADNVVNLSR